jgi:sugar phosphate permease
MKYRWELLLWLWLAFFFNQADRQIFNVLLPLLRHDLGLSDVQLGLVGTVFVVANGLMVPVAGFLGDILSRKRIIVVSLFAWSLATLCTGFGTSLLYFLVARSLATAVGEAFFFPSAVAMLASEHEETRARALSLFQTSVYLGLIGSGWVGGALAEQFGWRSVFWIFGAIGMALSLALSARIRETRPAVPQTAAPAAAASQIAASARAILSQPVARYIALASAATIFVNIGYLAWMPAYLFERFQMPLAKAGLTSMLFHHALAFMGVILGGMISDRYAPGRPRIRMEIQGLALLAGAPFLFLLGRAASEWMAYGALAGFGFFRGLFESNLYPAFYSVISPRYHAAASGLLIAFSFLAASAAPVLLGKVKETAGLASGISALSAFYVAGAVAVFAGSRRLC